jgi:hypothetical protein
MNDHHLVLSRDYFNPKFNRMPRNQREAGIDHLEWERRMRPLRPLTDDIGYVAGSAFALLFVCMKVFA